jgi:malate/lactate dehydrogenase
MMEVAIVGAGELGGALAYLLARRDITPRIRLIDTAGQIAAGKSLDIMQASPIDRFATTVSGHSDVSRAAGASVVVLADRAGGAEWQGGDGLQLLAQLSQIAARSVVVCAGAAQRELIEQGVRDRHYPRGRLFGSAPEALAGAIRAMVALETDGTPGQIGLAVMGVPPTHTVIAWEEATIGGLAATRVLDEPARRRIAARIGPLWPPGIYSLAAAAAETIACLLGYSRGTMSCFVAPEAGSGSGQRARAAALPVCLAMGGITRLALPTLSPQVQVALDNAMLL